MDQVEEREILIKTLTLVIKVWLRGEHVALNQVYTIKIQQNFDRWILKMIAALPSQFCGYIELRRQCCPKDHCSTQQANLTVGNRIEERGLSNAVGIIHRSTLCAILITTTFFTFSNCYWALPLRTHQEPCSTWQSQGWQDGGEVALHTPVQNFTWTWVEQKFKVMWTG